MAKVKASDVVIVRKLLVGRGAELEAQVRARLSPAAFSVYQKALTTEWIELGHEAEIFSVAAQLLFFGERSPLQRLGEEVARIQFSGIYRIFLLVPTLEYVVKQVSKAWKTLYDQGDVRVEGLSGKRGTLVAQGLPELSRIQREYIGGYLSGVLSLTGAKNVRVTRQENDPQAWKWTLEWD